ncbi:MAG: aquaporin [Candidatus Anstonellales archaeon]
MKRYIAEFLASFILVFLTSAVYLLNTFEQVNYVVVPLGYGLAAMVAYYAFWRKYDVHATPLMSFAMLVTKKIEMKPFVYFLICQFLGALIGVAVLPLIFPQAVKINYGLPTAADFQRITEVCALCIEALCSLVFVLATYRAFVHDKQNVPWIAGLSYAAVAFLASPITAAMLNPLRALALGIISGYLETQPVYWIGGLLGAGVGALIYNVVFEKE